MFPTSCSWLLRQNEALLFPISSPILQHLSGGINPGSILELCGPSGTGKSQLCWSLVRDCLQSGHKCVVISNRGVPRHHLTSLQNLDNLSACQVGSVFELLTALSAVEYMTASLVVVEGIQTLLQAVLGSANFRGHALLNDAKCALGAVAGKSAVVYTNGIVSIGDGNHGPALGLSWETVPSVRVMLLRDSSGEVQVWRNKERRAELRITSQGHN